MKRWNWGKSWILVWGSSLFVAGLILYIGYQSVLSESAQEKASLIKTVQAFPAIKPVKPVSSPEEKGAKQNNAGVIKSTSNFAKTAKAASELTINDFPSPVKGRVIKGLGDYYSDALHSYTSHEGFDYAEPEGAVIRATHGGKVIFAGQDRRLGQKVTLDCGGGWIVTYGCLENLSVQLGETVEKLDRIGQIGLSSGAEESNGQTQLHYEVWHNHEVQSPK